MRRIATLDNLFNIISKNSNLDDMIKELERDFELDSIDIDKRDDEYEDEINKTFDEIKTDPFGNKIDDNIIKKYGNKEYIIKIKWSSHAIGRLYLRVEKSENLSSIVNNDLADKLINDVLKNENMKIKVRKSNKVKGTNIKYIFEIRNIVKQENIVLFSVDIVTVIKDGAKPHYKNNKIEDKENFKIPTLEQIREKQKELGRSLKQHELKNFWNIK